MMDTKGSFKKKIAKKARAATHHIREFFSALPPIRKIAAATMATTAGCSP